MESRTFWRVVLIASLASGCAAAPVAAPSPPYADGFDAPTLGAFWDGSGWRLTPSSVAPSAPNVLAGPPGRAALLFGHAASSGMNISVMVRPEDGAGGIAFRWEDGENFFVALVDGAIQEERGGRQELRIDWYQDGVPEVFKRFPAFGFNDTWGELRVVDTREGVDVHYNGARVASVDAGWDMSTGRVGLFTNGTRSIVFDDFQITAAGPART